MNHFSVLLNAFGINPYDHSKFDNKGRSSFDIRNDPKRVKTKADLEAIKAAEDKRLKKLAKNSNK